MNYIDIEKKLLLAEKVISRDLKQAELLSKLDRAAVGVSSLIPERVPATAKTEEILGFGESFVMPLRIVGNMLGIGRHKVRYYTEEELKKAVEEHGMKKIPLKLDHRGKEVASTIGVVDRIFWDDEKKVIRYEAHVNDETHARNIYDQVITDVSAGVLSVPKLDVSHGIVGKDLEFSELSFVEGGSFLGNSIEVIDSYEQ